MTIIKSYICDVCKMVEGKRDELFEVRLTGDRHPIIEKHAHKACLVKIGLLPEQEPLAPEKNAFLDHLSSGRSQEGEDAAFIRSEEPDGLGEDNDDDN